MPLLAGRLVLQAGVKRCVRGSHLDPVRGWLTSGYVRAGQQLLEIAGLRAFSIAARKNYFCSWAGAVARGVVTTDIDTLP